MAKVLNDYKKYFLLSSSIFFIFALAFMLLSITDKTYEFYNQALQEIKKDSLVPRSVKVHLASYNETQVMIEFTDKDLDGVESLKTLAIYDYQGTEQGRLKYYYEDKSNYTTAYYQLINSQRFPNYVTNPSLHPFRIIGWIALGFCILTGVISRVKWHDKGILKIKKQTADTNDIEHDKHDDA